MRRLALLILAASLAAACAVGPDYRRPSTPMVKQHRGAVAPAAASSLADLAWWEVFQDSALRQLVAESLTANYDLKVAAAKVEQMRALAGVAKADFYPQLGYQLNAARGQNAGTYGLGATPSSSFSLAASLNWELDIWGRVRRTSEAARAQLFSAEYNRRAVVMSLVAQVAQAYFELCELDLQLEITRRSVRAFQETYELFSRKQSGGAASKLEIARAGAALTQAKSQIPTIQNNIFLKENQINFLLGRPPQQVRRGQTLSAQRLPSALPAGLPASLLERRPDVREAEESLRAANAQIGVAKAGFFPKISLSGLLGLVSPDMSAFSSSWAVGGGITGPLFQGLRVYDNYAASKAQWEQAKLQYQKSVLTALQDVSNALMQQRLLEQVRAEQAKYVEYLRESFRLAKLRYMGGLASYYEVLDAQEPLFPAETTLAQTDLNRLLTVVQLYKALGGGWGGERK